MDIPSAPPSPLPDALRDRVLARLGLDPAPPADTFAESTLSTAEGLGASLGGLRAVYRAWCAHVPFDNVRKLIALRTGAAGPLPGADAAEFLEAWLAHGCGGTCWPSSNALHALLRTLGFDARRVAGSMRDIGVVNHGSVKVAVDGRDWLVDSSMLTNEPLPLGADPWTNDDPVIGIEVEPAGGTHVVWSDVPPHAGGFPCRLLLDPVDRAFHADRYEGARERSPFNQRLYARRNLPDAVVVLRGPTRFRRTARGVEEEVLSRDALCASLRDDVGISAALVERWVDCGALDATYEPLTGPPPPPITSVPPSRR